MISAKFASQEFLKIKIFWKKVYDVIILVNDFPNKTLSGDSNYSIEVVLWPKFGNFRISVREAIMYSIL